MPALQNIRDNKHIRKLVPLNTLPDEQFEKLLDNISVEQVEKGGYLFEEGDIDQQNIYLLSGEVVLSSGGQFMERVDITNNLARYPLAHQFPRKLTGQAASKVTFMRLDNRLLSQALSQSSEPVYEVEEVDLGGGGDWMVQLLGSRVLQLMPSGNVQEVLRHMEMLDVKKDEEIFHQGDEGDYYYFISQGHCRLTRTHDPDSEPEEVAQLGPGDNFGEDALLSGSPRNCTITMMTDGVLLRLSKEEFEDQIKRPLSRNIFYTQARQKVKGGAVWLDVRSTEEHDAGHLPGSINLPFELLRYQMSSLATGRDYVAYCNDGRISAAAAYLLTERNIDVAVLERGLQSVPAEDLTNWEGEEDAGAVSSADPVSEPAPIPVADAANIPSADEHPPSGDVESLRQKVEELKDLLDSQKSSQQEMEQTLGGEIAQLQERNQSLVQNLEESEARFEQLKGQYLTEVAELQASLEDSRAKASEQAAKPQSQADDKETEVLRQALKESEARFSELQKEFEDVEDQHLEEMEEVHALWEKRLRELEAKVAG